MLRFSGCYWIIGGIWTVLADHGSFCPLVVTYALILAGWVAYQVGAEIWGQNFKEWCTARTLAVVGVLVVIVAIVISPEDWWRFMGLYLFGLAIWFLVALTRDAMASPWSFLEPAMQKPAPIATPAVPPEPTREQRARTARAAYDEEVRLIELLPDEKEKKYALAQAKKRLREKLNEIFGKPKVVKYGPHAVIPETDGEEDDTADGG